MRCHDNLTAAVHMLAEAVFWFHPLLWWIGKRLVDEREQACDEEVLRLGSQPQIYAESILKVCELYLESPFDCVSGITGSNLRKRIRTIMTHRIADNLSFGRKLLLTAAGTVAIGGPIISGLLIGQSSSRPAMTFEVASVKPSNPKASDGGLKSADPKARSTGFQVEYTRFTATNLNLFTLIVKAYGLNSCRPIMRDSCPLLSGGPDWLKKDEFDIVAKMPDASPDYTLLQVMNGRAPQLQLMLQALLADRFHLQVHRETRQVPVFVLAIGKKGPKVKKAEASGTPMMRFYPQVQANGQEIIHLVVKNSSMQELVGLLSQFMDRPVLDQTGLKDKYDFALDYEVNADAPGAFTGATGPGLFRALQDQAGLKLEATKGPVEVLVIDHAEKPSAN